MDIDRKRIAAVHALEALGYRYHSGEWLPAASSSLPLITEADAMHGALMRRAEPSAAAKRDREQRRS